METVKTIKDTRIKVKLNSGMIDILKNNQEHLKQIPENISKLLQTAGVNLPTDDVPPPTASKLVTLTEVDIKLLNEVLNKNTEDTKLKVKSPPKKKIKSPVAKDSTTKPVEIDLYLSDLHWLSEFLGSLRAEVIVDVHLNDLLENSHLELPQNERVKRSSKLEARCKKLRAQQQNREYRKMTKNVDATLKNYPEDTVAYQMHAMNCQIIAVLQFIFSIATGFVFGFLGIELIIGHIDFGVRLLLGILLAVIVAIAEIYFLSVKLSEYDNEVAAANKALSKTVPASVKQANGGKAHKD